MTGGENAREEAHSSMPFALLIPRPRKKTKTRRRPVHSLHPDAREGRSRGSPPVAATVDPVSRSTLSDERLEEGEHQEIGEVIDRG